MNLRATGRLDEAGKLRRAWVCLFLPNSLSTGPAPLSIARNQPDHREEKGNRKKKAASRERESKRF